MNTTSYLYQFRAHTDVEHFARFSSLKDRLGFVFIDPWAVYGGHAPAIIKCFQRKGLLVVGLSIKQLTEAQVEHLYRKNSLCSQTAWHLARQIHCMGISVGLLLYKTLPPSPSIHSDLLRLKGPSNPVDSEPGMIRYDFRSPNRSIKLLHSADDWEDTLAESLVYFDRTRLGEICAYCVSSHVEAPSIDLDVLSGAAIAAESLRHVSFGTLSIQLRNRLLHVMGLRRADIDGYACFLNKWDAIFSYSMSVREEAKAFCRFVEEERVHVAQLARTLQSITESGAERCIDMHEPSADPPRMLNILRVLNNLNVYKCIDVDTLLHEVTLLHDRWEKVLLATTMFHINEMI